MINLYYGDDRVRAQRAIHRLLGGDYESFDGVNLAPDNLTDIFRGTSLCGRNRKILIKDLSSNKTTWEKLPDYLDTPHQIVIWEQKFDKRTKFNKMIANHQNVKILEFKLPVLVDRNLAFTIYDVALRDGPCALKMLEQAESTQDPYMLLGAWSWKAIDNLKKHPNGAKEKRVLRELSKLDIQLKTSPLANQPWLLLQAFLLRLSSL